ncbi:MAG: DUF3987 domain-containing protein [Candidatus Babeliales bacterium]
MTKNPVQVKDFVTRYMEFCDIDNSEAPAIYHRWTCMSMLSAFFGRSIHIEFGTGKIYPNQYIMLMGDPGTRKGTAMGIGKKILKAAGYNRFSADKTSKERFLMDMKQYDIPPGGPTADLEAFVMDAPTESYICSGEFTDFIGQNNMEFITMLTNMWDNLDIYTNPKITGKSVTVERPTVNLLGANTPEGFALAFPPEALGNGFLSRVIMLYAEVTGNKVAWPEARSKEETEALAQEMIDCREAMEGEIGIHPDTRSLGSKIYKQDIRIDDVRFSHYKQRRFIHLLKNSMVLAAMDMSKEILPIHMIRANTLLAHAELRMPKALGEFGASRHATVSGKIINFLSHAREPQTPNEIWKAVRKDIQKASDLAEILTGLKNADEIQAIKIGSKTGYMPKRPEGKEWPTEFLDTSWLTEQEFF